MVSFTKCITALLGEMLYADDTAMIAPIDINDDNNKHFIKNQDGYSLELYQARKAHHDQRR